MCTGSSPMKESNSRSSGERSEGSVDFSAEGGTREGNSSRMSCTPVTHLAPCWISRLVPALFSDVTGPGTANTSRPCSRLQSAVMRALRRRHHERAHRKAADDPVSPWKVTEMRRGPRRHLLADRSLFDQCRVKAAKMPGINHIHPRAELGDRFSARLQSAPVGLGIDAGGHAAHHHPSPGSDLRRHFPRHPPSVMRRLAGAHHGKADAGKEGSVPSDIEHPG